MSSAVSADGIKCQIYENDLLGNCMFSRRSTELPGAIPPEPLTLRGYRQELIT